MAADSFDVPPWVRAVRLRDAILWCDRAIESHAELIGHPVRESDLPPNQTAIALAKMLPDIGLAELVGDVPIEDCGTHQQAVAIVGKFRRIMAEALAPLDEATKQETDESLRDLRAVSAASGLDPEHLAETIRAVAYWCNSEAEAMRALLRHAHDIQPEACRTIVQLLIRHLKSAGQSVLAATIDYVSDAYANPMPVIGLLTEIHGKLERIAHSLEISPESPQATEAAQPYVAPTVTPKDRYVSPAQIDILLALKRATRPLTKERLAAAVGLDGPHGGFGRDLRRLKAIGFINNRGHGYFLTNEGQTEATTRAPQ